MKTQFEKIKEMYWTSEKGQKIKETIKNELHTHTQHIANPHHIQLMKIRLNNKIEEKIKEMCMYINDNKKNIVVIILKDELENEIWIKKQIKESVHIIEKTVQL